MNLVWLITTHFTDDVIVTTFRFTYWLFVNFALKNFSSLDSKWCMRTLTWQRRNLGKCSTTLFTMKCGKNTTAPKPSLTSMKKSTKKRVLENKHKLKSQLFVYNFLNYMNHTVCDMIPEELICILLENEIELLQWICKCFKEVY